MAICGARVGCDWRLAPSLTSQRLTRLRPLVLGVHYRDGLGAVRPLDAAGMCQRGAIKEGFPEFSQAEGINLPLIPAPADQQGAIPFSVAFRNPGSNKCDPSSGFR